MSILGTEIYSYFPVLDELLPQSYGSAIFSLLIVFRVKVKREESIIISS